MLAGANENCRTKAVAKTHVETKQGVAIQYLSYMNVNHFE